MPLRPLLVITGNISVAGGDHHTVQQTKKATDGNKITHNLLHTREVTTDRRAANVVATAYMRKIRGLAALRTPYGALVEAEKLAAVKAMVTSATRDVAAFNERVGPGASAQLTNGILWEHLRGNRLGAVEGWIARRVADKDNVVEQAATALTLP